MQETCGAELCFGLLCYQRRLMSAPDEQLLEMARRQPYAALAFDADPDLGFAGIRALRELAEFCEAYQVRRLRGAGHSWAQIAAWAGVSAQALHKRHAAKLETQR